MARLLQVGALAAFSLLLVWNHFATSVEHIEHPSRSWGPYDWGRILMAEVEPNALVALSPDSP